ncbi:MAG: Rrf2 family iron-sulfur cluster assembly transcriptional regulator [Candidatus Azotimanducaceae bacterium]|jgi:Rrf2 family iron-sulfur cluster assembly transcriptional regulator
MRLTAKGRYAVTAMLDLAVHHDQGPISLADVSERQGISLSYLEQLFAKLRRKELVKSVRGPGGGYQLNHSPGDIYIAQIVDSVDENVDATKCAGRADCQQGDTCLTHDLWSDLSLQIHNFLSDINLASLIEKRDIQLIAARQEAKRADIIRLSSKDITTKDISSKEIHV